MSRRDEKSNCNTYYFIRYTMYKGDNVFFASFFFLLCCFSFAILFAYVSWSWSTAEKIIFSRRDSCLVCVWMCYMLPMLAVVVFFPRLTLVLFENFCLLVDNNRKLQVPKRRDNISLFGRRAVCGVLFFFFLLHIFLLAVKIVGWITGACLDPRCVGGRAAGIWQKMRGLWRSKCNLIFNHFLIKNVMPQLHLSYLIANIKLEN